MSKKLLAKVLSSFLACLFLGFALNLARPMLIGEEWTYRERSLNLIDRTADLLTQYSISANDYLNGIIDVDEFKKRISSYDLSIENVDSEAHKLTPPEGYEAFHDHLMEGVHEAYDIFFYMSGWPNFPGYNLTKSFEDLNAAMDKISYAKSIMPEPKTPRPIDPAWIGWVIIVIGAIVPMAYIAYLRIKPVTPR